MRFLDYQKVKQAEREKATELFGTAEEPTELASKVGKSSAGITFYNTCAKRARPTDQGHQVPDIQCFYEQRRGYVRIEDEAPEAHG